ncbi:hypothetical protein [Lutimaribacter saemankumensis]|uniref:Uncharacterized protein n=1 Tax=Lutimaribacter saemankumensis TaxID=490829 RepID=A0A1G8GGX8_9RHOB|nr:hypothetical protein [Lutimaribacter saemankumensis]SDH93669.1 hypothetical protein SAMN05421850_10182 [Lutimaribacter saemankumensis]
MNLHSAMLIALASAAFFEAAAYLKHRNGARSIGALLLLGALAVVVWLWIPEPAPDRAVFGAAEQGFPVMVAVAAMLISISLGIVARYVFDAERDFDMFALLCPLVVAPLLLLPLIGTLDNGELQPLQLVSLSILSFQNGLFWQKVLASLKLGEKSTLPVSELTERNHDSSVKG